jgi:hypothetical protein
MGDFNRFFVFNQHLPERLNVPLEADMLVPFQVIAVIGVAGAKIKQPVAQGQVEQTLPGPPELFRYIPADLGCASGSIAWQLAGHGNYFWAWLWGMNNWRRSRKPDAMMVKIRGIALDSFNLFAPWRK